jgi:GntR family transcriptional repressor for pyruvate dehydrogenase complex
MNASFQQAPRLRLYEYVSEEIEKAIREKQILPGEKLPSENDLAEQFEVSRTIIREALKVLRERRLITVQDGKGAFVLAPTPEESTKALSRYIERLDNRESHEMLFEVRLMIEPELAYLAAKRAEKSHIDRLNKCMRKLKSARENPEKWIETDLEFHKIIAKATRNPYALVFIETLLNHMDFLVGSGFLLDGAIDATIFNHEEIVGSIKAKDSPKAREKMREHILQSQQRLSQALNKFSDQEKLISG